MSWRALSLLALGCCACQATEAIPPGRDAAHPGPPAPYGSTPSAGAAQASVESLQQELEGLLAAQARDWSKGDLEAFCAVYAPNALFLSPSGEIRGREQIFSRYVQKYRSGGAQMGELRFDLIEVQGSAAHATAAVRWHLTWKDKDPAQGLALVTFRREPQGWVITQDASM